jgi:hypothetical protein
VTHCPLLGDELGAPVAVSLGLLLESALITLGDALGRVLGVALDQHLGVHRGCALG